MSQTKRWLESEVEKTCTCGVGCVLDMHEHSTGCYAQKIIYDNWFQQERSKDNGNSIEEE